MIKNDFSADDKWQREMRDRFLVPFYKELVGPGRFIFLENGNCVMDIQRILHVDTIAQLGDRTICIEEKIVRWPEDKGHPYTSFALEVDSCTLPGLYAEGWMLNSKADFLFYGFETASGNVDAYLINFPQLQKWFWQRWRSYFLHTEPDKNRSRSSIVPIADVRRNANMTRFYITESTKRKISLDTNITEYEQANSLAVAQ